MLILNKTNVKTSQNLKKVLLKDSRVEYTYQDGTTKDFYAADASSPDDELAVFFAKVRNKFLDGRDRHAAQGSRTYKADTPWELQGEILDQAGYSAVLWFELERLKEDVKALKEAKGL